MPNGVHEKHWTPKGTGKNFQLASINKCLEPYKKDLTFLTNLMNAQSRHGDGHYAKTANWLTGKRIRKTSGKDIFNGISMDQFAANHVGHLNAIPSIHLAIEPTRTAVDTNVGFTQIYGGHISWKNDTTPVPKEIYPRLAFDRLFNRQSNAAEDKSVIDFVLPQTKSLMSKVSKNDQEKLEEFFTSVRELEKRIENTEKNASLNNFKLPDHIEALAHGKPVTVKEHMEQMLDIMVLAFQMNRTRIATFMFGNSVSGMNFSFLDGVKSGFHQCSHHSENTAKLEEYRRINCFHMEMFGRMLKKMKAIKEGNRTLLDNSMILCGSSLRDGNKHSPVNLPIILAGKAGGQLPTGQHLVFPQHTPLCKLYVSMLQAMGLKDVRKFSDGDSGLLKLKKV